MNGRAETSGRSAMELILANCAAGCVPLEGPLRWVVAAIFLPIVAAAAWSVWKSRR